MVYIPLVVTAFRGENLLISIILIYFLDCQESFIESAIS